MIDNSEVRAVLNTIVDPCSAAAGVPVGIADMGLVRHLEIHEGAHGTIICLTIGVTEPGCLMAFPFANEARKRLEGLPGVASVEIDLDHAFDWTPADMLPEYRARLEAYRAARRPSLAMRLMKRDELAQLRKQAH